MPDQSFILLSLKEQESKELAKVISNDTSRKILDLLVKSPLTETQIAESLSIPISTAHYNLKHLAKAKLVKADEYHYSSKGKEVLHYSLTNKMVIITPEASTESVREKLKIAFPLTILALAGATLVKFLSFSQKSLTFETEAISETTLKTTQVMVESSNDIIPLVDSISSPEMISDNNYVFMNDIATWFFLGCFFMIVVFILYSYMKYMNSKEKQ